MLKKFVIPLSALALTASSGEYKPISNMDLRQMGFLVTKNCMEEGSFYDCPLEQLQKIRPDNPLVLFQGERESAYILDLSDVEKSSVLLLGFDNNIVVYGVLQEDGKTIRVKKIQKYVYRNIRHSGVL